MIERPVAPELALRYCTMSVSLSSLAEPWGQLVRIECEGDADRFPFSTDEVKIGRAAGKAGV